MVDRHFNRPAWKSKGLPVFWLREFRQARWLCHECGLRQESGVVAFEFWVRFVRGKTSDGEKDVEKFVKRFFCLGCAEKMLSEVLEKVQLLKLRGVVGFRLLEEI